MCNDVSEQCRGKVAHMELGSQSEEGLLKEMLWRLTDMNLEYLGAMNIDEYLYRLKRDMMNVRVFLTIDNVSSATRTQALNLLRAKYGPGSVVLVTARSLIELTSLGILAGECMEMPELEMEEARSLFLYHVVCVPSTYSSNKDDHELVLLCIQRCYFKKGDGNSYHYHPLALQTLGEQLGCVGFVPDRWRLLLHEIDFLNPFKEPQHPVFSILRRSFDALNPQDQLLFMDVALFIPSIVPFCKWSIFDWIAMVYGIPITSVIERLENLKRKSLLTNLGNEFGKISMHDLWREFARLETKVGEFEKRRWMFEWDGFNALEEGSVTNGVRLVNMRRMSFLDKGFVKLEDVDFFCFPSVTVLNVQFGYGNLQELDLRGLKHLKSLDLTGFGYHPKEGRILISLIGLGSLLKLGFLLWWAPPSACIDEISCLTNLQVLDLKDCDRVPDLSNLILLRTTCFLCKDSVATIAGFSLNHTNLQFLDLSYCKGLESCPGVGELVALQELSFWACYKLRELPNLQKLKQLRKLNVSFCSLLQELPGLGVLVSLLELHAYQCLSLAKLPDMRNLRNLMVLDLQLCKLIKSLSGLNELVCLRSLNMLGCENLTELPQMHKLTNLQNLELDPNGPSQSFEGLNDLIFLQTLYIGIDESHDDGLDLRKLTMLTRLHVVGWQGQGVSSLAELVLLESAIVDNCQGVHVLPDLQRLSRLGELVLRRCEFKDMSSLSQLTNLQTLLIKDCNKLVVLPDLRELSRLEELTLDRCVRLRDVRGVFGFRNLKRLRSSGDLWLYKNLGPNPPRPMILPALLVSGGGFEDQQGPASYSQLSNLVCTGCNIQEFPDLANFPELLSLDLRDCVNLTKLTCTGPLSPQFYYLSVRRCMRLQALPDLTNSQEMEELDVANSGVVLSALVIRDMKARWPSMDLITEDDDGDFAPMTEDDEDEDEEFETITDDDEDGGDNNIDLIT